jgi:hypothetical protein
LRSIKYRSSQRLVFSVKSMSYRRLSMSKSRFSLGSLLFAVLFPIHAVQAAMIVPTGGTLSASANTVTNTQPVGASYGQFSVNATDQAVEQIGVDDQGNPILGTIPAGSSGISVGIEPNQVTVEGSAWSVVSISSYYSAGASGQLGFDLTDPTIIHIDWPADNFGAIASLYGLDGAALMQCSGSDFYSSGGGCSGPLVTPTGDMTLDLAAGHYDLVFSVNGTFIAGTAVPSSFSLTLTAVPLPAGVWLLSSALFVLMIGVRRRSV